LAWPDSAQEYFADGITEEILNALAQIPGLRVAGRSSSFSSLLVIGLASIYGAWNKPDEARAV
jgi:hypothetical protein